METELLFGRDEGSVPTGQSLYFARTEALIEKSIMLNTNIGFIVFIFVGRLVRRSFPALGD